MPDFRGDQASGLRRLFGGRRLRVVSFVAAGDGVGKTHVVGNLAVALARQGQSVLVLDENAGQDNLTGFFGAQGGHDLLDVIHGRCSIDEILLDVAPNLQVCAAARALRALDDFAPSEEAYLFGALAGLRSPPDVILVDCAHDHPLGISPVGLVAPETVVVLSGSSHAITGAYALIKRVAEECGRRHFRVLVNKVRQTAEAEQIFANLSRVATQRAVASIGLAGFLPFDDAIAHAAWLQQPVLSAFPESPSADALRTIASELTQWDSGEEPVGVEHFLRQLVHLTQKMRPLGKRPLNQGLTLGR